MRQSPRPPLELWGGIESTVNRVGDAYFDQMEWNGHTARVGDLDLIAALGIAALRYPILWERTAPNGIADADWTWPDERLNRLRTLGIRPIVGLVHHGSGPRHTNLLDPAFPEQLAEYAGAVATRYPWVMDYTPVNEPLTTARFSGLYGYWYPHRHDADAFYRILVNECRAVILAMRAIRAVNPAARLIQTEDLGKTFSTGLLQYQADYENERRWLSYDLICGRIEYNSAWEHMRHSGISDAELDWFGDNACPPDIVGLNYYITSERFLDEDVAAYPARTHGGNGQDRYADVEAVRVRRKGIAGPDELLYDAWDRYKRPIAITEAHLGGEPEEQLRWLKELWETAQNLWQIGVDLRAVTVWSLFGAHNWHTLVTRDEGYYEPGVFDVRTTPPHPTILAPMVHAMATGESYDHPALATPGWWRRPERLLYPPQ